VLSAVEGLEVVSPHFKDYVIPLTLVVLFCLFAVQKRGTSGHRQVLRADHAGVVPGHRRAGRVADPAPPGDPEGAEPVLCAAFMWDNPGTTFIILGATVLCVTGAEALYADLGHFGKRRSAWRGSRW
jgi:KUP system potassium uptake protein